LGEPIRTVVIDDEQDVRDLLRVRLERDGGFEIVGEGGTCDEAIAVCAEHQPHVLILDAGLHGENALVAVPEIRRAAPAIIIVIYTSATGLSTRNEAEQAGAHAVVGKLDPFDLLVGTIHRLLPELAPPKPQAIQERERFSQDMSRLLADGTTAGDGQAWWRRPGGHRIWLIVLLIFVVLPLFGALAWLVAQLAGHGLGLG
jgi:DNA-binding NarL/FixJ family response regulator